MGEGVKTLGPQKWRENFKFQISNFFVLNDHFPIINLHLICLVVRVRREVFWLRMLLMVEEVLTLHLNDDGAGTAWVSHRIRLEELTPGVWTATLTVPGCTHWGASDTCILSLWSTLDTVHVLNDCSDTRILVTREREKEKGTNSRRWVIFIIFGLTICFKSISFGLHVESQRCWAWAYIKDVECRTIKILHLTLSVWVLLTVSPSMLEAVQV